MVNINQVQTTINPYTKVIERAVYAMKKTYDYAPRSFDISIGDLSFVTECDVVLRQAALLEPGQSTENRMIQTATKLATEGEAREDIAKYIKSVINAQIVYVNGDSFSYEFKAQAHRHNDGCTVHVTFDTKYGGSGRTMAIRANKGLYDEDSIESDYSDFAQVLWEIFLTVVRSAGFSGLDDNEAEFLKKVRDNDLIPGVNLSSLSDEEIDEAVENYRLWNESHVYDLMLEHSGLSKLDFVKAIARAAGSAAEFDLSELSFNFEYDIEIDEKTFQSYFTIDSDEEHEAKLAEQARLDTAKANVDVVKPKVLAKLEEALSSFDLDEYKFNLEELAEQIAEAQNRVEVFNEEVDGDEADELFFSFVNSFAKSSKYAVHFSDDGSCSYSLTGDRKDEYTYSFEIGKYLYTGGYGETFIYVDGDLYDISGSFPHFADKFTVEDAFDLLSSASHCNVLELPQRLVDKGYKDFNDATLLSANDESEIYAWLDSNIYVGDIIDIIEEEELIETVVGEYDKTLYTFEIDFSDCFE